MEMIQANLFLKTKPGKDDTGNVLLQILLGVNALHWPVKIGKDHQNNLMYGLHINAWSVQMILVGMVLGDAEGELN